MAISSFVVTLLGVDLGVPGGRGPDPRPVPFWTYLAEIIDPLNVPWEDPSMIEDEAYEAVLASDEFESVSSPEVEFEWENQHCIRVTFWPS